MLLLVRRGDNTIFMALKPPKEVASAVRAERADGGPERAPVARFSCCAGDPRRCVGCSPRRRRARSVAAVVAVPLPARTRRAWWSRSSTAGAGTSRRGSTATRFCSTPASTSRGRLRRPPAAPQLPRGRRRPLRKGDFRQHRRRRSISSCTTSPIPGEAPSEHAWSTSTLARRRAHAPCTTCAPARSSSRSSSSRRWSAGSTTPRGRQRREVHLDAAAAAPAARRDRRRGPPLLRRTTASTRSASCAPPPPTCAAAASSRAAARSPSS